MPIRILVAAQATQPVTGNGLRELGTQLRHVLLPQGRGLPEGVWRRRHRALLILLWAHAVGLVVFGQLAATAYSTVLPKAWWWPPSPFWRCSTRHRQRIASGLVSFGLITSSAVLVHVWGGVIEAHFHFFVMMVLLTLYEDWLPFSLAAAYVVLHHGSWERWRPGRSTTTRRHRAPVALGADPRRVHHGSGSRGGVGVATERGRPG